MSELEDLIRQSLRSEAGRLHEVDPLRLPPAGGRRGLRRAARLPRLHAWYAPLAAAVAVLLVATVLVGARALRTEEAGSGATSSSAVPSVPVTGFGTPRYYLYDGWVPPVGAGRSSIAVMDVQTGRTIGVYSLPKGDRLTWAGSSAGDDRTFVVEATTYTASAHSAIGAARWYTVKIAPGSSRPVRVTPLDIEADLVTANATWVISDALSADGTELAVVTNTGSSVAIGVYSVATGRLQHRWSAAIKGVARAQTPVFDPSWVGDRTVAFAYTSIPRVREEVRTLDVGSGGSSLLDDSRVVWSLEVALSSGKPAAPLCATPYLTGDESTVVCATSSYSGDTKRLTALWMAYPVKLLTKPRVIGSVTEPGKVISFSGPNTVEWTDASGTEVIGSWSPGLQAAGPGKTVTSVMNEHAYIGHGQTRPFPEPLRPFVTW